MDLEALLEGGSLDSDNDSSVGGLDALLAQHDVPGETSTGGNGSGLVTEEDILAELLAGDDSDGEDADELEMRAHLSRLLPGPKAPLPGAPALSGLQDSQDLSRGGGDTKFLSH